MGKFEKIFVALVFFTMPGYSQINVGAKAGASVQHLWNFSPETSSPKLGVGGGFYLKGKMHTIFGIQAELLYGTKGGKSTDRRDFPGVGGLPDTIQTLSLVHKFQHIEVPFLFKFYAPGFESSEPNLFFGPYYSRIMSYDVECLAGSYVGANAGGGPRCTDQDAEVQEWRLLDKNEFGYVLGAGIDFGLGAFDLRYSGGAKKILEGGGETWRTGVVSAMVGFTFTAN